MQLLYVKYNRERHKEYQIKTIIQNNINSKSSSSLFVVKSALTKEAENHIHKIHSHYQLLEEHYKPNVLAKPLSYKQGEIIFEYIKGESLESLLLKAVHMNDYNEFKKTILIFKQFLDTVAGDNYCIFEQSPGFSDLFGDCKNFEGLRCFKVSNIDLNLDNIMLDESRELKVIDYEWVYPFAIPISFIVFRAFNSFYYSHYFTMQHFVSFGELLSWGGIIDTDVNEYIRMSQAFASLVGTEEKKADLNKYRKKIIKPSFEEPAEHKAQLFVDEGQGFSEKESTYFSLSDSSNILKIDLSNYQSIKGLRFDPIQGKGTIYISKSVFRNTKGETVEAVVEYSNAILHIDNYYVFNNIDPQIYYEIKCDQDFDVLEIEMTHFEHIPYELTVKINENFNFLISSKNEVEQNCQMIKTEVSVLQVKLAEHQTELENEKNENLKLFLKYQQKENELGNTEKLFTICREELEEAKNTLEERNRDITYMVNTKWWKIRGFLVKVFKRR